MENLTDNKITDGETWYATHKLRWKVKPNRIKVLQQCLTNSLGDTKWIDIPVVDNDDLIN